MDPDADMTTSKSAADAMLPSASPAGADPSRPDAQDPPERRKQHHHHHHHRQGNGLAGVVVDGKGPPPPPPGGRVRTIDAELEALRDKGIARESRTKFNSSHTDLATMEDWYQNLRHQEEEMRRKKMDAERVLHSYQNNEFVPTNRRRPPQQHQQQNSSPSPTAHLDGSMGTDGDDDDLPGAKRNGEEESPKDISPIISRFDQLSREGEQYVSIGTSSSNLASAVAGAEEGEEEEEAGGKASEDLQMQNIDSTETGAEQIKSSDAAFAPASESKSVDPDASIEAASATTVPVVALEKRDYPVTRRVDGDRTTEGPDDFRHPQRQQQQQQQQQLPSPATPSADATGLLSTGGAVGGGSEASGGFSGAPNVGGTPAPAGPSLEHAPVNIPVRVSLGVLVRERDAEALLRFPIKDMRAHQSSSSSSSSYVSSLHIVENVLATMTEVVRDYCASLCDGGLSSTGTNCRGSDVAKYDPMFAPTIAGVERDASYRTSDSGARSAIVRCIIKIVGTIVLPPVPSSQPDKFHENGHNRGWKDVRREAVVVGVVQALKQSVASGRFAGTAKDCPALR